MREGCLICDDELEYLERDIMMECVLCGKMESSKTRCVNGHYVCNECHMKGLNSILEICLDEKSSDPVKIINKIMKEDFCHMHGPEHHTIVGASLLTAYHNAGGEIDLKESLLEMINRAKDVPGGICGFWGACGAGISTGIFVSIITDSTPLSTEGFKLSNRMTSYSLGSISEHGGPRCCKRDSFLAILSAIDFVEDNFGIVMDKSSVRCDFSTFNRQCLRDNCPFYIRG